MVAVMQEFPQDRERAQMTFQNGVPQLAARLLKLVEQRADGVSAGDLVKEMLEDQHVDEREIERLLRLLIDRGELRLGQRLKIVRN